ncbi:MAG: VIT domain-containing protein [Myxococcota bacterium]
MRVGFSWSFAVMLAVACGGESYPRSEARPEEAMVAAGGEASSIDGGGSGPQTWRRVTSAPRFATVSLGGGETLELRQVQVRVQVDGLRARTIVDHIFFNPHSRTIEGTFRYPLPSEASVSSYAMYLGAGNGQPDFFDSEVQLPTTPGFNDILQQIDPQEWGELRVGRIVKQAQGREVYENVTRRRIDPALVEEVSPNSFEARVFPIQANGYHRVIVSYDQTLARVERDLEYLFPVPAGDLESFSFELTANADLAPNARTTGDFGEVSQALEAGRHEFGLALTGETQQGTLAFRFSAPDGPEVLAGRHPERDEGHVLIRLHGDARLPAAGAYASRAVFLLDTSLSEEPDRFNLDVALLNEILTRSPAIEEFQVITFDAGARRLRSRWTRNSNRGRAEVRDLLDDVLLEGATDLSAALDELAAVVGEREADVFLLTDGALNWGDRSTESLLRRARALSNTRIFAYRTGLGAENLSLLRSLAQGGVFNCVSTSSLPGCGVAHHGAGLALERIQLVPESAEGAGSDIVVAGGMSTFTRSSELVLAARLDRPGRARLVLEGKVQGQRRVLVYPVDLTPRSPLASRAWAELAIQHLLASDDEGLEELAVAMSQHYRIPTRLTSFLVLETDAEYEQYNLEGARQAQQGRDIATLTRLAVPSEVPTSFARLQRALRDGQHHHRLTPDLVQQLYSRIQPPGEFLSRRLAIPLGETSDGGRRYRRSRDHDPEHAEIYRTEAARRQDEGELPLAIRALSSAVENAPRNAEIARMVAYTLDGWNADAEAAELFLGVLEQRPYEPQSYRDLANVLWTRHPGVAALLFEAVLSGTWDNRFVGVVDIVREEYALFVRAVARQSPGSPLARFLYERQQVRQLRLPEADLRVTMTWNTDNTDIDLWVTDPDGNECYYGNRRVPSGGELLEDVTRGFGPERFQAVDADEGTYRIEAKYYSNNGNRLLAQTYVTVTVATGVGSDDERIERHVVSLEDRGDEAVVAEVRMR